MFKRKDDFKTFVVIILVCIICIIIGLIFSYKSNYDKLVYVNEYNVYFTNVNYINNFISKIANIDSISVYDMLDKKYIDSNNINVDNVLDYFNNYSVNYSFAVDIMNYVQVKDNFIYYIKGKIYENVYDSERILLDNNFSVILSIDNINKSYSIYPVNDNYKSVINNVRRISIMNNVNNSLVQAELITKEQVCAIYLSNFINIMFEDYDSAYNLLSDDMKDIYFDSEDFKKNIFNNFELISSTPDRCRLEKIGDKRIYTVIDNNENTYVFTEESVMKYKVDFYLNKDDNIE